MLYLVKLMIFRINEYYKFQQIALMRSHSLQDAYLERIPNSDTSKSIRRKSLPKHNTQEMKVGRYTIHLFDLLGKGFSSKVYKATRNDNAQIFAAKVILCSALTPNCLRMCNKQAELHAKFNHPNVVRCFEVLRTDLHIIMILEYCQYGNLAQSLHSKVKLKEEAAIEIIQQISAGYKYLAEQGILHRDLKPANIMKSGDNWKIADFGFTVKARVLTDKVNVGTPLYMPPEALGKNIYSIKSDIFAIGVICYELIHGKRPWEAPSERQLLKKMLTVPLQMSPRIGNVRIKHFLTRTLEMQDSKRMSLPQFMFFSFKTESGGNPQDTQLSKMLSTSVSVDNILGLNPQTRIARTKHEIFLLKCADRMKKQIQLCRQIYYLMQNNDMFLMQKTEKKIFAYILVKYAARVLNDLNLEKDQLFRDLNLTGIGQSKIFLQLGEYAQRYNKISKTEASRSSFLFMISVKERFPLLENTQCAVSRNFHEEFKKYLRGMLRECNHLLMLETLCSKAKISYRAEAIQALLFVYTMVARKAEGLQIHEKIVVETEFGSSKVAQTEYFRLRKELKCL